MIDLIAEQIFADDAGHTLPGTHVVIRVFWEPPDPDDMLFGVVGSPSSPLNVSVTGGTFFDSPSFLAGDRPPAFGLLGIPGFEEVSYDSWFTIGNSSLDVGPAWPSGAPFEDQVIVAPGTFMEPVLDGSTTWNGGAGGPDNVAWTVPPSQRDPGSGETESTPQAIASNWPGNRVLMMQLSVIPDGPGPLSIDGSMGIIPGVDGEPGEVTVEFSFALPAPSALAVLAYPVFMTRRRR